MALSSEKIMLVYFMNSKLITEACHKIYAAFGERTIAEWTGKNWFKEFAWEMKIYKINLTLEDQQRQYQAGNQA